MPDKKKDSRSFEAELRTLPIELVPPDPAPTGVKFNPKPFKPLVQIPAAPPLEGQRGLVDRLIDRIKRL